MKVKKLKEFLNEMDEEKDICVAIDGGCFINLSERHLQQIDRFHGYNGYIINGNMYNYKGIVPKE